MATYTDYADDTTGNTLYAKPEPLTTSPWSTGVVTGAENGSTGSYAFSLNSTLSYVVYRQAGGSPASTDLKLGRFSKNIDLDTQTSVTATAAALAVVDTVVDAIAVQTTAIDSKTTNLPSDPADASVVAGLIAEVKAKTDLIGTGGALVASPVSASGELTNPIIAGDDYLAANGRAFEFTVAEPTGFVAGTSTAKFGGEALNGTTDSWLSTGTITDNGSTWLLKFDLTKTQTAALSEGLYKWSVELTNASGTEHTVVRWGEEARVVDKQT